MGKIAFIIWTVSIIGSSGFAWGASADWGTLQVQKMLQDRPVMATYQKNDGSTGSITQNDLIFRLAVDYFNGAIKGQKVQWLSDAPSITCEWADHIPANGLGQPAGVRIANVEECPSSPTTLHLNFNQGWSVLFFEFQNIQNDNGFEQLMQNAVAGADSRCQWIESATRMEYLAAAHLKSFYLTQFLTWAQAHQFSPDPAEWQYYLPGTYELWIQDFQDPQGYPWNYWGGYFDQQVVPQLQLEGIAVPKTTCTSLSPLTPP